MTLPATDTQIGALRAFRKATDGLSDHSVSAQVVALRYELFQSCRRSAELEKRSEALSRQLEQERADALARTREHQTMAVRFVRDLGVLRRHYEKRLEAWTAVHAARQRRCATLEELCRLLLLTIERAAGAENDNDSAAQSPGDFA